MELINGIIANYTKDSDDRKSYKLAFKKDHSYESRKNEASRIMEKYPFRIPVIVEIAEHQTNKISLNEHKYLVPTDLTVGQFVYKIRKRILINPSQAIFFFTADNTLPQVSRTMLDIYKKHMDEDTFLYLSISLENTFGDNGD
jgi:GABA(A) receptor-associated protein